MTLILKRSEIAKDFVTGGQGTIGLRIPKNKIALNLLAQFENIGGLGIAAPSANRFGAVSPTSADHVLKEIENSLNEFDLLLDGGNCEIGIESTIIDCSSGSPRILRPGAVTLEAIKSVVKSKNLIVEANNKIKYSGIFNSHYSPKAKVFLNTEPRPGDGFIAMDGIETPKHVFRLSAPININDFATKIYASLRSADELNLLRVVVITPPNNGIGIAINDRLRKASEK
jgi:L-threonylcarbamoyladenylate synthase